MSQHSADDVVQLIEYHERVWARLSTLEELRWYNFPWPMLKRPSLAEDITYTSISAYINSKYHPNKDRPLKGRIKDHIQRWHHDHFETRLLSKVVEEDREKVKEGAGAVIRNLNELLTQTRPFVLGSTSLEEEEERLRKEAEQEKEKEEKKKERVRTEKEEREERLRKVEEEDEERKKAEQNWNHYEQSRERQERQSKQSKDAQEKQSRDTQFRREQEAAHEQELKRAQDEAQAKAERKRPDSFDPEAPWSAAVDSSNTGSSKTPQRSSSANISTDRNSASSTTTWNPAWSTSSTGSAWSTSTKATTASGVSTANARQAARSGSTKPRASSTSSDAFNATGTSATGASPSASTLLSEAECTRRQEEQNQKRQEQSQGEREGIEAARLSEGQATWSKTTKPRISSSSSGVFNAHGTSTTGASPLSEAEWRHLQDDIGFGVGTLDNETEKEERRDSGDTDYDWDEDLAADESDVSAVQRSKLQWSELSREKDSQRLHLNNGSGTGVGGDLLNEINWRGSDESDLFLDAFDVFKTVFSDKVKYGKLLQLEKPTAQSLLDVMQTVLDHAITSALGPKFEKPLLKAMLRLSKQSALYPSSYILTGIKRDAYPVTSGYFGEIFQGEINGRNLALKVFKLYANEMDKINDLFKGFYKEAILWRYLVHPNLLPFYGIYQLGDTGGRICLVSPWMSNGNICQYLQRYPDTNRQHLIMDIARGISYLHGKSIVHGDLKGANVLVSDNGVACLADFGLSSVYIDTPSLAWGTNNSSVGRSTGTLRWQAPELIGLEDSPPVKGTTESDIYAFACVCYEIFVGKIPHIRKTPSPPEPNSTAYRYGLTDWMWSLIEKCWDQNPTKRPMISDVVDKLSSKEEFLDKYHENWGDLRPEVFRSLLAGGNSAVSDANIRNSLSLLHSLNTM
ncbi:hypothetical protein BDQ17DRAFT_1372489 [Cyathus striatus]|nr:hypothetical protein BDQ17DRAFT_1372489 [Cyathus striatus]